MGMHSPGEQIAQSRTDNKGPPGPKGTQGREGESGRGSQGQAAKTEWDKGGLDSGREVREGPAGSTRLRAAPLASPPTFSGPRTGLRPPATVG